MIEGTPTGTPTVVVDWVVVVVLAFRLDGTPTRKPKPKMGGLSHRWRHLRFRLDGIRDISKATAHLDVGWCHDRSETSAVRLRKKVSHRREGLLASNSGRE